MNIFIVAAIVVSCPQNIFGSVELQPANSLNLLESNSSSGDDSAFNISDSRIGRKKLMELHLNPYDPIARIASQLWGHLFSKDRGMLRFPFKKPTPITTIRPIFISPTTPHSSSHNGPISFPPLINPMPSQEENTTMMEETESPTDKPAEQPQPTLPPNISLPTLPTQTIPTQSPPQGPGVGTPQLPSYPPQGPVQGPGGQPPQGPGGQPPQGPGGQHQVPGGHHPGPGYPPQGPGNQYPGQGYPPVQQQPPGYPQQPPGQFIPNQPMPGGPFLLDGQINMPLLMPGFVHHNLHMYLIKNSPPDSSEANADSSEDTVSIIIPSTEEEFETEGFQQNHKPRPSLTIRNETAPLSYGNSKVYSTKAKQGLLLHFGSFTNPMKTHLQFYISPDFSLFIKPSKMVKKKTTSNILGKEIEFYKPPSVVDVENLQETIPDDTSADKISENSVPMLSNGFTEGLAYLLEMFANLSYTTTNFPITTTEKEAVTPPTFPTESKFNNSNLQVEEISEANQLENISTIHFPSQPLVNKHENTNQTTKRESEIVYIKQDTYEENLISGNIVGRKSKPLVYYSIIGPKNITYIDVNANGRFGKQKKYT